MSFGLAAIAPRGLSGFWPFMLSAAGLAIVGLALVMIGLSIEETGTIARIRLGVGARIFGFGLSVAAGLWGFFFSDAVPNAMGIAVVLYGLGLVGAAIAFRFDFAVLKDVRYGQAIQLVKITRDAVSLIVGGVETTIPTGLIRAVQLARSLEGRAAFIHIVGREKILGAANQLPWLSATREGDTFVLTEHQAGLDVEELARQLLEASRAAQEGGYR